MSLRNSMTIFIVMLVSLSVIAGMPDSSSWFIQQLTAGSLSAHVFNLDVSESMVVWDGGDGVYYYDGTGTYLLQYGSSVCYSPSASQNNIVCVISGEGILYYNGSVKRKITVGFPYEGAPDVHQTNVVWEGGSSDENTATDVYLNDGLSTTCLTDMDQCWHNGNSPKISQNAIVWRSYDGNDNDIFLLKDGAVRQLTNNDVEDYQPFVSDNGHVAWVADQGYGWHAHYFDGEHTWQLTIGNGYAWIWGVSDDGVLYSYGENQQATLYFFDGIQVQVLYESDDYGELSASIGGGSIAWAVAGKIYFYKDGQITSWDNGDGWMPENIIGVWGNRIIWRNYEDWNLYFAEDLDSPICTHPLKMDGNSDCRVDLTDFMLLAGEWLQCGYDSSGTCE